MTPKIVCVAGPTACGKTTLGVLLAQRFHGEVVSADSMQIYRGMTVGTAAPAEAEMQGVPHHMIAVAEPSEQWSAAEYVAKATPIVDDILSRGKRPILVGEDCVRTGVRQAEGETALGGSSGTTSPRWMVSPRWCSGRCTTGCSAGRTGISSRFSPLRISIS